MNDWFTRHGELMATLLCGLLIGLAYLFPAVSVPLFISAFVIGGFAKAKEGIEDFIHHRRFNVEILMILAAIGAGMIGYWAEGAILIFIFALSGAMETYTMNKSERDLSKLMELQPDEAIRIQDGEYEVVPVSTLAIGEQVLIKPGERVPIDGQVIQGVSSVNEAPITGEAVPVHKQQGDDLFAGTLNGSGSIILEVTKRSGDTLFQKIVRLVQEAQQEKAPSQQFVERFEKKYVQSVLIVVGLMFFLPHYVLGWSWHETWYRALVLLVVASPCALVASISPAVLSVLSYGARHGVLIKGGSHIERISSTQVVAMDKTGTITTGEPQVTDVWVREGVEKSVFLESVMSLEQQSTHPIARAIVHHVEQHGLSQTMVSGMTDVPGKGIYGYVSGTRWAVGSARFVGKEDAEQFVHQEVPSSEKLTGKTLVFVRDGNGIAGAIALQDGVRDEARQAIQCLQAQGIHVVMITGDHSAAAESIANEVGISTFIAEALPDEKMRMVEELRQKHGAVVMIGDGINDAPALAKADIGLAMGGGTDIALDTADLVLVQNNLQKVDDTIRISKKMNRIIKQNVTFSLVVIALLVLANFLQVLSLPLGVIGHEGSTILVILNGLRLLRG